MRGNARGSDFLPDFLPDFFFQPDSFFPRVFLRAMRMLSTRFG
jgi:hypothetical protein